MSASLTDTTVEAQAIVWRALRALSPSRRLEMAFELSDELRHATRDGIRRRHPDYDERQVELALRRLMWGEALFVCVYPNCPVWP